METQRPPAEPAVHWETHGCCTPVAGALKVEGILRIAREDFAAKYRFEIWLKGDGWALPGFNAAFDNMALITRSVDAFGSVEAAQKEALVTWRQMLEAK